MKDNNVFSYKPDNPNQKIWQVCTDPKSNFVVLEVRQKQEQKNTSQLLILDTQKQKIIAVVEMKATQTLLNFFDKTILLSEIDFQNEMPIAKGLQALNMNFEVIWELEEVIYYGIIEENNEDKTEKEAKVIFSLQSNYYSVPLKISQNQKEQSEQEIEAKEEEYDTLNHKIKQYFYSTNEYSTNHTNYNDISGFVLDKTNQRIQNSILYTENSNYLICSYLAENENYLLCTDTEGNLIRHFLIENSEEDMLKNPQEIFLMKNKLFWIDENEFYFLKI